MKPSILIAGATGYLGQHLIQAFYRHGYRVGVIVRNEKKIKHLSHMIDTLIIQELSDVEALKKCMSNFDTLISTIGITKQKDKLTYMTVDYGYNFNLLQGALHNNIKQFMYIGVLNGPNHTSLKIIEAKERFVNALVSSDIDAYVIRPSGFFSDIKEIYEMAKKGKAYVVGDGNIQVNPIHGQDLAEFCVKTLNNAPGQYPVGGPHIFSQRDLAQLAFDVLGRPAKIRKIPKWLMAFTKKILTTLTSQTFYGPIEFFLTVLMVDMVGPTYGKHHLKDYFSSLKEAENDKKI